MIKSAIKHSAIRSAIRKPFVPNDDGYREYLKRSVFEFNGTQWGELSEPVVLSGDFEIEWVGISELGSVQRITCSNDFEYSIYINQSGTVSIKTTDALNQDKYVTAGSSNVSTGQVHTVSAKRIGDVFTVSDGNDSQSSVFSDVQEFVIDKLFERHDGSQRLNGSTFSVRVWTNGDRNTGDLILNVPFDESSSDYQRNRAVALGGNLCLEEPAAYGTGWTQIVDGFAANTENYTSVMWSGAIEGEKYLISCYQYDIENPGLSSSGSLEGDDWRHNAIDGVRYWLVTASSSGRLGFKADGTGVFKIKNCSIQKWAGVILQNALPEHWMQIERKRWWDYWLGPELYSQDIWENPDIPPSEQWVYGLVSNEWVYSGDGTLSALKVINPSVQPDVGLLSYSVNRTSGAGSFAVTADSNSIEEYTVDKEEFDSKNPYFDVVTIRKSDGTNQEFKRRSGILSVRLNKPSFRRKLEIAQ